VKGLKLPTELGLQRVAYIEPLKNPEVFYLVVPFLNLFKK
jgi:hypothetical protein